ncbi:MAG: class IV adenylate cyclase [Desulfosalsimonadaceae bacterium]
MPALEIEVKFFLADRDAIEKRIQELPAEFCHAEDEKNIRYETPDCALFRRKQLLRLRRARDITLTFKSEPPEQLTDCKVHREYEVCVDDFAMMQNILESVGFHPEQIYEKHRSSYRLEEVVLCLDTMPYGNFLELEGPEESIREVTGNLGLEWRDRIVANYLEIFEQIKTALGLSFSDVTFANFAQISRADMEPQIRNFEAGRSSSP